MRIAACCVGLMLACGACSAAPTEGEPRDEPPAPNLLPARPPNAAASEQDAASLVAQLGHADWQVRRDAMRALIALGAPARDPLRQAAKSPDAEVRWRARYALSRLEASVALPPPNLARILYRSAALARAREDGQEAAKQLYVEVTRRFPGTKWAAAATERLAGLEPKPEAAAPRPPSREEVARLVARLSSPAWHVRQQASCRLAELGAAAREALEQAAKSPDNELAWRAQRLLDRLADDQADDGQAPRRPAIRLSIGPGGLRPVVPRPGADIDRLVEGLSSGDADRVAAARELLVHIGGEAVGPLIRRLDHCDEVTSVEIIDLLGRITGEKLGFDPERWKAWWRRKQRE